MCTNKQDDDAGTLDTKFKSCQIKTLTQTDQFNFLYAFKFLINSLLYTYVGRVHFNYFYYFAYMQIISKNKLILRELFIIASKEEIIIINCLVIVNFKIRRNRRIVHNKLNGGLRAGLLF